MKILGEEETENEERKKYIEVLMSEYSYEALTEIARSLGLNPDDYPNKRAIAEEILNERESEESRSQM